MTYPTKQALLAFTVVAVAGCLTPTWKDTEHREKVVDKEAGDRRDYGYAYQYGPMCPDYDGDGGFHYGYCYQYGYHYGYFPEASHQECKPNEPAPAGGA